MRGRFVEDVRDGAGQDCCYMRFDRFYLWNFKMGNLGEIKSTAFYRESTKNGCKAEAVCVKTKDLHKSTNRDIYRIVKKKYEYMVNGQKYYITLKFESGVMKNPPYYITVYYDKRRPKKAVYAYEGSREKQVQTGCGYTALATFCTMFLVARLLAHLFS